MHICDFFEKISFMLALVKLQPFALGILKYLPQLILVDYGHDP